MCDPEAAPLIPCDSRLPLTLEKLREYEFDPFWMKVRATILLSLFILFIALFSAAAVEARNAPSCYDRSLHRSEGQVYRVETSGLSSSEKSHVKGIISKLDYLVELGIKIIWISPIYKSPMKDFGYDIEDFCGIDEMFGTIDDFRELVTEMKKRDLKLVMDLVPNHTSDMHPWFKQSIERIEPYTNYYIWEPPKKFDGDGKPVPPNNWVSVFGGSAWEYNEKRKEFYLHQFAKEQPDLNYRNENVLKEMLDITKFWLDLGVDGFRLDSVSHLFEDPELRDEPIKEGSNITYDNGVVTYDSLSHIHTHGLPEVMDVMQSFREYLDQYSFDKDKLPRLLMAEVYDSIEETMKFYGSASQPLADFPFNFLLITNLNSLTSAQDVMDTINLWMKNIPEGKNANWVLGNHDQKRVATRLSPDLVDGMHMISLLLPGTAVTYYGEEIGMEDTSISWKDTLDPAGINAGEKNYTKASRDPARTPMQWNSQNNSGFSSSNTTWLPVNKNFKNVNVEDQQDGESHLNVYKKLVKARNEPSIKFGSLDMKVLNNSVFTFTRYHPGSPAYLVAVNWSDEKVDVDFSSIDNMSEEATVYVQSINSSKKDKIIKNVHAVSFGPKEGLVLIYNPVTT